MYGEDLFQYGEEEADKEIMFVDNDQFNFCKNRLTTLFFWCMIDLIGMVTFVQQHCKKVGLSSDSGSIPAARDTTTSTGIRVHGRDTMVKAMISDQREMMDGFTHQQRVADTESQLILLNNQIRSARAYISQRYVGYS